ncbi:MAG TPA: hypothetical protein VG433_04095 [Pirellulales bacterium]|nr:hypothetical protein [Pirellulales bacterium]
MFVPPLLIVFFFGVLFVLLVRCSFLASQRLTLREQLKSAWRHYGRVRDERDGLQFDFNSVSDELTRARTRELRFIAWLKEIGQHLQGCPYAQIDPNTHVLGDAAGDGADAREDECTAAATA